MTYEVITWLWNFHIAQLLLNRLSNPCQKFRMWIHVPDLKFHMWIRLQMWNSTCEFMFQMYMWNFSCEFMWNDSKSRALLFCELMISHVIHYMWIHTKWFHMWIIICEYMWSVVTCETSHVNSCEMTSHVNSYKVMPYVKNSCVISCGFTWDHTTLHVTSLWLHMPWHEITCVTSCGVYEKDMVTLLACLFVD